MPIKYVRSQWFDIFDYDTSNTLRKIDTYQFQEHPKLTENAARKELINEGYPASIVVMRVPTITKQRNV